MEMDNLYDNAEDKPDNSRPLVHQTAPQVSRSRLHGLVFLGLLCGFLLVGLIGVRVHYFLTTRALAAELLLMKSNLRDRVQTGHDHISNLTEERDRLNASLVRATQELKKLGMDITCPAGWRLFSCSCYFLSSQAGYWELGRDECKTRGAHLIIINSEKEQEFIRGFQQDFWIGLSDTEEEGTWKWVDGSPLTVSFWYPGQPNNNDNNPNWGAENCAHTYSSGEWNDLRCDRTLRWMCEK